MKARCGKKVSGPDGWAESEWKQITLEKLKPMRIMVEIEENVGSTTLEQLIRDLVQPAGVSTAAVALIPREANQMPALQTVRGSSKRASSSI